MAKINLNKLMDQVNRCRTAKCVPETRAALMKGLAQLPEGAQYLFDLHLEDAHNPLYSDEIRYESFEEEDVDMLMDFLEKYSSELGEFWSDLFAILKLLIVFHEAAPAVALEAYV